MSLLNNIRRKITQGVFNIGFIFDKPFESLHSLKHKDIHWLDLNGYKNGWFADPFLLNISDNYIDVLVEEFEYSDGKGRLCKLKVDLTTFKLIEVIPILTLSTHLSFPLLYNYDQYSYIIPENNESGYVKAYNFLENQLINPKVLISESLVDTQFIELNGLFYAFGTVNKSGAMEETKDLHIYRSSSLLGAYELIQVIHNDLCEERGAGSIFINDGKIIRPAQCCEGGYGKGVIFYELQCQNGNFLEKEVFRIEGDFWHRWGLGMHQYHSLGNVAVVDGYDYKFFLGRILKRIQSLFR